MCGTFKWYNHKIDYTNETIAVGLCNTGSGNSLKWFAFTYLAEKKKKILQCKMQFDSRVLRYVWHNDLHTTSWNTPTKSEWLGILISHDPTVWKFSTFLLSINSTPPLPPPPPPSSLPNFPLHATTKGFIFFVQTSLTLLFSRHEFNLSPLAAPYIIPLLCDRLLLLLSSTFSSLSFVLLLFLSAFYS